MKADFDRLEEHYCFCIVCRCVFVGCEDDPEHVHDQDVKALRVITDFMGGTAATKIEVPTNHFMATYWKRIKVNALRYKLSSFDMLFQEL